MNHLVFVGGCSKAGKSSFVKAYSHKHNLSAGRMFDYIRKAGIQEGIDDVAGRYVELEMKAISLLCSDCLSSNSFLLDMHYAIQPKLDTALATGQFHEENLSEPYQLSMSERAVKMIASTLNIQAIHLYAREDVLLQRRMMVKYLEGKTPRSVSPHSIRNELLNEQNQFQRFCEIAGNIQSVSFDNSEDLDTLINAMESMRVGI